MPIAVWSRCSYVVKSDLKHQMRQDDWNAVKIKQALKGQPIKGFANVVLGGDFFRLDERSKGDVPRRIGLDAAALIKRELSGRSLVIIPVPNKSANLVENPGTYPTLDLAKQVGAALTAVGRANTVVDALRWTEVLQSASKGGPRHAEILKSKLKLIAKLPPGPVVLVDDVVTTGSHIRAVNDLLATAGAKVRLAVCGTRAQYIPADKPLELARWDVPTLDEESEEYEKLFAALARAKDV